MERIERYRVTNTHMVPTMFVRLLKLDPDIVVMMIANPNATDETLLEHRRFWNRLKQLTAVREDRIHFLVGGEHFYTGPGILRLVEALTNQLHHNRGETP